MRWVAIPLEKCAKRCAAMAELRLLFRAQLGKGFSNLRKIKQRIVAEAIGAAWSIEDDALGCTAEDRKRFSIASGGDDANEASGALIGWNINSIARRRASEVAKLAGIRRRNQDPLHHVFKDVLLMKKPTMSTKTAVRAEMIPPTERSQVRMNVIRT